MGVRRLFQPTDGLQTIWTKFGLSSVPGPFMYMQQRHVLTTFSTSTSKLHYHRSALLFSTMDHKHPKGVMKSLSLDPRPSSVPPQVQTAASDSGNTRARPTSIPRSMNKHKRLPSDSQPSKTSAAGPSLDLVELIKRSEPSVVKARTGSVLSRGFILKTDHYPSG